MAAAERLIFTVGMSDSNYYRGSGTNIYMLWVKGYLLGRMDEGF